MELLLRLEFSVPPSRAYWKGYLKLSFVSVRSRFILLPRRRSDLVPAGQPAYGSSSPAQTYDSVTGEAVDTSNKARGYEVGENEFLLVEDRDLDRARSGRPPPGAVELSEPPLRESPPTVPAGQHEYEAAEEAAQDEDDEEEDIAPVPRPQNMRTIEIERFLQAGQIDARYFEKPYYIAPRKEIGQKSFAVIRDAMSREGLARPCPHRAVLT